MSVPQDLTLCLLKIVSLQTLCGGAMRSWFQDGPEVNGGWGDPLRQGCDPDLWHSLGFVGEALWARLRG